MPLSRGACRAVLVMAGAMSGAEAAEPSFSLLVQAGGYDRRETPIRALVPLADVRATRAEVILPDGTRLPGQLTAPGLGAVGGESGRRELHVVLPALKAGSSLPLTVRVLAEGAVTGSGFAWAGQPGQSDELTHAGHPVLRYQYQAYDPKKRGDTTKVFHHLFDPIGGHLLTKGPGGQFPHHRGIFFGFMKVSYGSRQVDIWHCKDDTHQAHGAIELAEAGTVLGRQRLLIHWNAKVGETFADEQRELTAIHFPGGTLVEFTSRLSTKVGDLILDGDPQHAGFHFRAANDVATDTKAQTVFTRPDGAGKPGETRNWPHQSAVNLPWVAMTFVSGGKTWTVAYLDHPDNPKEARYSEREYGRFGSYFKHTVTAAQPLAIRYRLWVQAGTMTVAEIAAKSRDFVTPPVVTMVTP